MAKPRSPISTTCRADAGGNRFAQRMQEETAHRTQVRNETRSNNAVAKAGALGGHPAPVVPHKPDPGPSRQANSHTAWAKSVRHENHMAKVNTQAEALGRI
jgi:hypothetical protein